MNTLPLRCVVITALVGLMSVTTAQASTQDGGSGLIRVDQAYSMPVGRPLFTLYAGYYDSQASPGTSRFFSLTPSVTAGLGQGFEGSASMLIEGLTSELNGEQFGRRFDVRRRDLTTKLRWTGPLATSRFRVGLQGMAVIPLGSDPRAGNLVPKDSGIEPGIMGMVSTNVGWFNFPLRIHANIGHWWSRDDGAFYYRDNPAFLALSGDGNDVTSAGLGFEAGFRRAVVLAEVTTEHFMDQRGQIRGSENLWRGTLGFRTLVGGDIGLTAGVSFDLSSDDDRTAFDPDDAYADVEFRAGITLGSVLSRDKYETKDRDKKRLAAAAKNTPAEPEPAPELVEAPEPEPVGAAFTAAVLEPVPVPEPKVVVESPAEARVVQLEARIQQLETVARMTWLESRIAWLEGRQGVTTPAASAGPAAAEPTPVQSVQADVVEPKAAQVEAAPQETRREAPRETVQQEAVPQETASTETASTETPLTETAPQEAASTETILPATTESVSAELTPEPELESVPVETPAEAVGKSAQVEVPVEPELQPSAVVEPPVTSTLETAAKVTTVPPADNAAVQVPNNATVQVPTVSAGQAAASSRPQSQPSGTRLLVNDTPPTEPVRDPEIAALLGEVSRRKAKAQPEPDAASSEPPKVESTPEPLPEAPAEVAPVEAAPVEALPEVVEVPPFPFESGSRMELASATVGTDLLATDAARDQLNTLAAGLLLHPGVQVALIVHTDETDPALGLQRSQDIAMRAQEYLVLQGVAYGQIVPLGLGNAENAGAGVDRIEAERIR